MEDPFDVKCFLKCIDFFSYTFKTFILWHKSHPLILQTSEHVWKQGLTSYNALIFV